MRAIDRLRHLLETHGIYTQAVKLMRQSVSEAQETTAKASKGRLKTLSKVTNSKEGVEEAEEMTPKASKGRLKTLSKVTNSKEGVKEDEVNEVSPPGFKGTVKTMKSRHKDEIDNPYALAWWQKNQGYKSHKTRTGKEKRD